MYTLIRDVLRINSMTKLDMKDVTILWIYIQIDIPI